MSFNASKCYILSLRSNSSFYYQLNDTILQEVPNNPYLGISISNDLKWGNHINNTCRKANSTLGFIRRNLHHSPKPTRRLAYIALVRSTLEYGSIIWDPFLHQDIDKMERVQRKAARFITRDYKSREPGCMTRMLEDLDLPSLQQRRKEQRLAFFYKVVGGSVPAIPPETFLTPIRNKRKIKAKTFDNCVAKNFVESAQLKNSNCFKVPETHSDAYKTSFFPKTISEWNQLEDITISAPTVENFKKLLQVA